MVGLDEHCRLQGLVRNVEEGGGVISYSDPALHCRWLLLVPDTESYSDFIGTKETVSLQRLILSSMT